MVEFLIKNKADVNARSQSGSTPMLLAMQCGCKGLYTCHIDVATCPHTCRYEGSISLLEAAGATTLDEGGSAPVSGGRQIITASRLNDDHRPALPPGATPPPVGSMGQALYNLYQLAVQTGTPPA